MFADDLIGKVARSLQQENDAARKQEWDAVLVSKYLYELREARKQGRKERRHKEAQAVLAAATAAAAASSRMSSLRKDNLEESIHHEVIIFQFLIMETTKTVLMTFNIIIILKLLVNFHAGPIQDDYFQSNAPAESSSERVIFKVKWYAGLIGKHL